MNDVVFIKFGKEGDEWYVNINYIIRIYDLSQEQCTKEKKRFPTCAIEVTNSETPLCIHGLTAKAVRQRIKKAVNEHITGVIEEAIYE